MATKEELIAFKFDNEAEEAVQRALDVAGALITEVSAETEKNIRNLIAQAIIDGVPPAEAARQIIDSGVIGLTQKQGQAVKKFQEELVEQGITSETVRRKTEAFEKKLLRRRAETISRTEILDALNAGQDEAWKQAQAQGLLPKQTKKVVVLTVGACSICVGVASRGAVPVGRSFVIHGPPFHPRCRCTIAIDLPSGTSVSTAREIEELEKKGWKKAEVTHTDGTRGTEYSNPNFDKNTKGSKWYTTIDEKDVKSVAEGGMDPEKTSGGTIWARNKKKQDEGRVMKGDVDVEWKASKDIMTEDPESGWFTNERVPPSATGKITIWG